MSFVLDASVTASWLMPDERNPIGEITYSLISNDEAIAPSIWWFEIRNMLVTNERRGRLDASTSARILRVLEALSVVIDTGVEEDALLKLARRHKLTVYDAAYLELAIRRGISLATLDAKLGQAARSEGVALVGQNGVKPAS